MIFAPNGQEWLVDARGCAPDRLRSRDLLAGLFDEIVGTTGLHPVGEAQWHVFDGEGGVTGLLMLSESHLACHTYPEEGYAAFSLYSCGPGTTTWPWSDRLRAVLDAEDVLVRVLPRGPSGAAWQA
jgi:S-adenosylmethionine decarboxylase